MADDSSQAGFLNYPIGNPLKFGNRKPSCRAQVPSRTNRTSHQVTLNAKQKRALGGTPPCLLAGEQITPLGLLRPQVQGVLLPYITDFNYRPEQTGVIGNTTALKLGSLQS